MSSLDVTLDSLIQAKPKSGRGGGRGNDRRNSGGRGGSSRLGSIKVSSQLSRASSQSGQPKIRMSDARVNTYIDRVQVQRAEQVSQLRQPFDNKDPPVRQTQSFGGAKKERAQQAPRVEAPVAAGSSIFDRLGNNGGLASGTSVTIQKLNKDILPSDISELCVTIGEVKSVNMLYDSAGQSTGRADVTFSKRSDALSCVQRFHNVALDGTPMQVQLTGEQSAGGSEHEAPQKSVHAVREAKSANIREGLFGTAFNNGVGGASMKSEGRREDGRRPAKDPSFSVTMRGAGGDNGRSVGQGQGQGQSKRRDEHDDRGDDAMPVTVSHFQQSGNRGGGAGGGRGQGRKRGDAGGGRGSRGVEVNQSDLDSAMDAYMSNK